MKQSEFIKILEDKQIPYKKTKGQIVVNGRDVDLSSLTNLPEGVQFNNARGVDLSSLTTLPEGVQFNNGGDVVLRSRTKHINSPYLKRFNVTVNRKHVIQYKRVSKDFKTQEGEPWETTWTIGTTLEHPNWQPEREECGSGKFHCFAKPFWCDSFRAGKDDKYIAIKIHVDDLYEWVHTPQFPQKIGFRKGKVMYECDRMGNKR